MVGRESRYFSSIGIPNARVLPEPVEALPMTLCFERMSGMAADWIGVGVVKLSLASARSVDRERPRAVQAGSATGGVSLGTGLCMGRAQTIFFRSLVYKC